MTRFRGQGAGGEIDPDGWYNEVGNVHNIVANEATNRIFVVGATDVNYDTCLGKLFKRCSGKRWSELLAKKYLFLKQKKNEKICLS